MIHLFGTGEFVGISSYPKNFDEVEARGNVENRKFETGGPKIHKSVGKHFSAHAEILSDCPDLSGTQICFEYFNNGIYTLCAQTSYS